jgi:hypothetical protein
MYSFFNRTFRNYRPLFSISSSSPWKSYSWVLQFIVKTYTNTIAWLGWKAAKPALPPVIDPLTAYLDQKKANFLRTYENSYANETINQAIDKCFYDKNEFFETIMDRENDPEKEWKTRILFESTPRGNIVMYYDVFKQGFAYYSDVNNIPYSILNAVAMKYVLVFRCRDFFMDTNITPENEPSPFIKIYVEEPKKTTTIQPVTKVKTDTIPTNLYAKFKVYNKGKGNDKANDTDKTKPKKDAITNTFTNRGKIMNFSLLQKAKKIYPTNNFQSSFHNILNSETQLQKTVLDYKQYKQHKAQALAT